MSDEPRDYHLNAAAGDELDRQTDRIHDILERLAAHLAAREIPDDPNLAGLVESTHVQRAAELLLSGRDQQLGSMGQFPVFVSYSHADDSFVAELVSCIEEHGIRCFKANRDIEPAADWADRIWSVLRDCRVMVSVVTHRFINSRLNNITFNKRIQH